MKKFWFQLIMTCTLMICGLTAWADDGPGGKGREHDSMSAEEMSAAGLLAASAIGAGVYIIRRRSHR